MKFKAIMLSVMAIGLGLVVWGRQVTARADLTSDLAKAPQGVPVDSYFKFGTISNNSAVLTKTDFGENQAVQLTDAKQQLGMIWTSDDARMNLNVDQTASMWMYFGDRNMSSGDGMAFVMQNDDRKISASTVDANGHPVSGETLGVWGTDQDKTMATSAEVAKTGIQNSWALEFDTFKNVTTGNSALGLGSSFDSDPAVVKGYAHIASGFPGDAGTYTMHSVPISTTTRVQDGTDWLGLPKYKDVTTTDTYYYASMNHVQPIVGPKASWLVNGNWYHVTLKWDATAQTMTYIFDDKDPSTGLAKADPVSKTVSVPKSKIDPQNTGTVRWGFTGSTGENWEPNAVVFEQVPGIVNATANATLKDETTQKTVTSGATVGAGHSMRLTYNLAYTGGSQNWKDIQAKLNLPSNISFSDGTIDYGDSKLGKTYLTADDLKSETPTLPISEMSQDNPTATITLNGTAKAGSTALTLNKFVGANALTDASVPAFTVQAPTKTSALNFELTGDSAKGITSISPDDPVSVTGQLHYDDNSTVVNKTTTLHPVLNGESLQTQPLSTSAAAGAVTYDVPTAKLLSGQDNTLQLYAEDGDGRISRKVTYTITVKSGSLDLSVPTGATFKTTTLAGREQRIQPSSDLNVSVSDTRGEGNKWTLYAKATPFVSLFRETLPATLIYKDGQNETNLTAGYGEIMSRTTTSDRDVTTISNDWSADEGLLLDVQGNAIGGTQSSPLRYGGVITWSFTNAPDTN